MTARKRSAAPRNKYGAKPTTIDGIRFASKAEAHRYLDLKNLQRAGDIEALELQVPYTLTAGDKGELVSTYRADFRYLDCITGQVVVEDVKGVETQVFKLKAKHMLAEHGIRIKIIGGAR